MPYPIYPLLHIYFIYTNESDQVNLIWKLDNLTFLSMIILLMIRVTYLPLTFLALRKELSEQSCDTPLLCNQDLLKSAINVKFTKLTVMFWQTVSTQVKVATCVPLGMYVQMTSRLFTLGSWSHDPKWPSRRVGWPGSLLMTMVWDVYVVYHVTLTLWTPDDSNDVHTDLDLYW